MTITIRLATISRLNMYPLIALPLKCFFKVFNELLRKAKVVRLCISSKVLELVPCDMTHSVLSYADWSKGVVSSGVAGVHRPSEREIVYEFYG